MGFTLYLGPMWSGKTSAVLGALARHRLGGRDCVLVKSARDTRYGEAGAAPSVQTHEGVTARSAPRVEGMGALRVVSAERLRDVRLAERETVVGIDEGQFFEDLREGLEAWADKTAFVAALDGTHRRVMFGPVARALPLATHITKLRAVCMMCPTRGRDPDYRPVGPVEAPFTARTASTAPREGDIEVGGGDIYRAVCGACYARLGAAE